MSGVRASLGDQRTHADLALLSLQATEVPMTRRTKETVFAVSICAACVIGMALIGATSAR